MVERAVRHPVGYRRAGRCAGGVDWVCVVGGLSTNRAARQADRLSRLSDAYQQARFAVAAEESLERKYRLEPGPEVRTRYQQAAASLLAALEDVHQRGTTPIGS